MLVNRRMNNVIDAATQKYLAAFFENIKVPFIAKKTKKAAIHRVKTVVTMFSIEKKQLP